MVHNELKSVGKTMGDGVKKRTGEEAKVDMGGGKSKERPSQQKSWNPRGTLTSRRPGRPQDKTKREGETGGSRTRWAGKGRERKTQG